MQGDREAVDSAAAGASLFASTLGDNPIFSSPSSPVVSPVLVLGENITRLDLYNAFAARSKVVKDGRPKDLSKDTRLEILTSLLGNDYATALESHKEEVQYVISSFIHKCEIKYKATNRHTKTFLKKHNNWLSKKFMEDLKHVFTEDEHEYFLLSKRQQSRHRKKITEKTGRRASRKISKNICGNSYAAINFYWTSFYCCR